MPRDQSERSQAQTSRGKAGLADGAGEGPGVTDGLAREISERAVAKIERFWRSVQRSMPQDSHASEASAGTAAPVPRLPTLHRRRGSTASRGQISTPPLSQRRNRGAAATRIQRLWRRYRDAVDEYDEIASTASTDGVAASGTDSVRAAYLIQQQWRRYQHALEDELEVGRDEEDEGDGNYYEDEGEEMPSSGGAGGDRPETGTPVDATAAVRIQTLWKRYRRALNAAATEGGHHASNGPVSKSEGVYGSPNATSGAESSASALTVDEMLLRRQEAARRIEATWLRYSAAVAMQPSPDDETFDQADGGGADNEVVTGGSVASPPSGAISEADVESVATALALENLLMRDIDELEGQAGNHHSVTREASLRSEQFGDDMMAADEQALEELFLASVSTAGADLSRLTTELASHHRSESPPIGSPHSQRSTASLSPQTRSLGTSQQGTAASAGFDEVEENRAAFVIQRFYNRFVSRGGAEEGQHSRGVFASRTRPLSNTDRHGRVYETGVVRALSVLQHRFRHRVLFQRLHQMVEERDRLAAVRRIQELWRQRRDLNRHFSRLRDGRRESAARCIQEAFRAYRGGGVERAVPPPAPVPQSPSSPNTRSNDATVSAGPQCIVCMESVVQIALLPCGHAQLCADCSGHLRRCPTCRKPISLQVRIYL